MDGRAASGDPKQSVIRKVKRPVGIGRWPVHVVGTDQHGLWLYSPKGTIYRGQSGTTIGECEVGQGDADAGYHVIHLIPNTGMWMAYWCRDHDAGISVDICSRPTLVDDEWTFEDLELDVVMRRNGRVEIQDEDEFEEACDAGHINDNEAALAIEMTKEIAQRMQGREEPFGTHGWDQLAAAVALSMQPITTLRHISIPLYKAAKNA